MPRFRFYPLLCLSLLLATLQAFGDNPRPDPIADFRAKLCAALGKEIPAPVVPESGQVLSSQPEKPVLKKTSIIIDTNLVINTDRLSALIAQFRRRRGYPDLDDIRVTDQGRLERQTPFPGFREDPSSDRVRSQILGKLIGIGVGGWGSGGDVDREIVTEAFCALPSSSGPPVFATADRGIFMPLFGESGRGKGIPDTEILRLYPYGFDVKFFGRTIIVVPVSGKP